MKTPKLCLALGAAALFSLGAQAQISVNLGGSLLYDFSTTPTASEFASTNNFNNGGGAGAYANPAQVAAAIQGLNQTSVGAALLTSAANGTSTSVRHNTAGAYLISQPTTVAVGLLKATLRNNSGGQVSHIDVSYNFDVPVAPGAETAPGHEVFFSTNGLAGSWVPIPNFSGLTAATAVSATLFVGVWEPNTDIYLLWADDNSSTGTDGGYSIDNFQVQNVVPTNAIVPLNVVLNSPTNDTAYATPGTITGTATTAGTLPTTSVAFYVNGAHQGTDTTAPYSFTVTDLPAGSYTVQAWATNNLNQTASSTLVNVRVRNSTVGFSGLTYDQNFDGMVGGDATLTPEGWFVGQALPANTLRVIEDDGSLAPNGAIDGDNYGTVADSDRSLGNAPTGADRNIVLRLRNNLAQNIDSFFIKYDGETWRTHATAGTVEHLTNYVSFDNGVTWIPTGANYDSQVVGVAPAMAVNGNDPANRGPDITSLDITPATPVSPGSVILIRWQNFNDGGTDGGMSIDNVHVEITSTSPYTLNVDITNPVAGTTIEANCAGTATIPVTATASGITTNVAFEIDGGPAVNATSAPFSASLAGVGLGNHTITATAKDSLGNTATDTINVTVVANQPPVINFTNTYSGANTGLVFLVGSPITCQFNVSDANLTNIEFLVNNVVILATNVAYGTLTVGDALAGNGTLTVRATDTCGNVASASRNINVTNPPVTVIVPNGSSWKYFNTSNAPANDGLGRQWFAINYDDTAWLSGFAEIGGGDAVLPPAAATVPERTLLNVGPAGGRFTTAYFRHTFNWPSAQGGLIVNSLHDDGAVVYLNGTIVATFNMPIQASYAYGDFASGVIAGDGSLYYSSNITASLVAGQNVLAVEVHQDSLTSSDLSFDLMLHASVSGPTLNITSDGLNYTVTWSDPGNAYRLQQSTDIGNPANWTDIVSDPSSPYVQAIPAGPGHRFFRLRQRP